MKPFQRPGIGNIQGDKHGNDDRASFSVQGVQNLSNRFIEAEFLSKILISERIGKIIAFEYMPFMIIYIREEK